MAGNSRSLAVNLIIGGRLNPTLKRSLGDAETSGRQSGKRLVGGLNQAKLGASLSADVIKYRDTLNTLKAKQAVVGSDNTRLAAGIADVTKRYRAAKTAAKTYGITIADVTREHRELNHAVALSERRMGRVEGRDRNRNRRSQIQGQVIGAVAPALLLAAPLKNAIEFETKLAEINKVVDFKTPRGLLDMGDAILRLSTDERIPMAASGLADITAAAGQAGIARHELVQFTRDAAKIGVAFDLSGEEAGSAMTGMRSIFSLNQKEAVLVADAYNHLSNNMDATARGILRVANRTGSLGKIVGLSGQQIGALGATFLALKTPPEVAATGINALLTRLATADKQPAKFQQALSQIGYEASDLKERMKEDAQGTLLEFLGTVEGAEDKIGILADLFGAEYADDMAKLVGSMDTYRKALGLVADETIVAGSSQREYAQRAKTTANDLVILRNQATRLGVITGRLLLPSLKTAASFLERVSNTATDVAERFPLATKVVGLLAIGLIGLKVATLGARFAGTLFSDTWLLTRATLDNLRPSVLRSTLAMGRLQAVTLLGTSGLKGMATRAIPLVTSALSGLTAAGLINPLTLSITLLAVSALAIIKYWKPLKAFARGVFSGIRSAIGPPSKEVKLVIDALTVAWDYWSLAVKSVLGPIDATEAALTRFEARGIAVGEAFAYAARMIKSFVSPLSNPIFNFGDDTQVPILGGNLGLQAAERAKAKGLGFFGAIKSMLFSSDEPPVVKPSAPVKTPAPLQVAASAKSPAQVVTSGKAPVLGHPPVGATRPAAPVAGIAPKPITIGRPPPLKATAPTPAAESPSRPTLAESRVTLSPTVVSGSGSAGQTINVDMSGMVINANTAADAQAIGDNFEARVRAIMADVNRKASAAGRGALHDGATASGSF